ncbi:MAG: hypothetical protein OEZ39_18180 [Gammaproteobacteria bacterium]|nr:hypothetical protein [Gammaproteobacteria bacterium]MDH5653795.1 hypothetical protein [Gammaproteobacteria bacterium]
MRYLKLCLQLIGYTLTETRVGRILVFISLPAIFLYFYLQEPDHTPPIFDAQVHYNEESWRLVSVKAVINTAEQLNVPWLLVGSVPNEGTLRLYEADPERVIPMFIPQFSREDRESWFNNAAIQQYMEKELAGGLYRGVGEFFLFDGQLNTPVVKRMVALAVKHELVLHARSDPAAINQLFRMGPTVRILWAHGGMLTPPERISEMLDRHAALWVEISHRDVATAGGELKEKWRKVMLRHPDRFLLGSGTYNSSYWYQFRYYLGNYRGWLKSLPPSVAERIAYRNGLVLFSLHDKRRDNAQDFTTQ